MWIDYSNAVAMALTTLGILLFPGEVGIYPKSKEIIGKFWTHWIIGWEKDFG